MSHPLVYEPEREVVGCCAMSAARLRPPSFLGAAVSESR